MEARDAAKQPIMHRTACHNTEVPVLTVNSAQVEKLWYKQKKKKANTADLYFSNPLPLVPRGEWSLRLNHAFTFREMISHSSWNYQKA